MNYQEQYKRRPAGFHDTNDGRMLRAGRQEERRRDNRAQNFARRRDVPRDAEEGRTTRRTDPSARLRRWKEERALKKKIEQQKEKPVFKVGIVHHKFYSPPFSDRCKSKTQPCHPKVGQNAKSQPVPPKRTTRATQKRLEARNLALSSAVASVSKVSPKGPQPANYTDRQSFAPANHVFTAPKGVTELPMFGKIAIPLEIDEFKLDLEMAVKETPGNASNNAGRPSIMKDRSERCMAADEPSSPPSLAAKSCVNSDRTPGKEMIPHLSHVMTGNALNNTGRPPIMKGRLERCMAVDEPSSPPSSASKSNCNSSTDFRLRLSVHDNAREKRFAQDSGLDSDVIACPGFDEEAPSTSKTTESLKESERKLRTSTPKTPTSLSKTVRLSRASKNFRSPLAVIKVTKIFKTPEVTMDDTMSNVNSDKTRNCFRFLKKSEESSGSESFPPKSSRKVDLDDDVFSEEFPAAGVDEALQSSVDRGGAIARIESYDSESHFDPMTKITVGLAGKRLGFDDESLDEIEDTRTAESATIVAAEPEPTTIPNFVITEPTPRKPTPKKTPLKDYRRSSRRARNILDEAHVDEGEEPSNTHKATIVAAEPEPTTIPNFVITEPTPRKPTPKKTPLKDYRRSSRRARNTLDEAHVDEGDEPINTLVLRNRIVVITPNKGNRRSPRLSGAEKETASESHNVL